MSRNHQKSRFKKGKGGKKQGSGAFGAYIDLVAKQVPKDRRRALLDSNAPLSQFAQNENQILRKLAECMAHGVVGPCPQCQSWNLKYHFKSRGFRCMGDNEGKKEEPDKEACEFTTTEPTITPFVVPSEFHDVECLKNYSYAEREKIAEDRSKTNETQDSRPERKDNRDGYEMAEKKNELFEQYYKGQGVIPEDEWKRFLEVHRSPLPCTFRVTGYKDQAKELLKVIKSDYFNDLSDVFIDEKKIDPPKCLIWYPDGLAWQLNLERNVIRNNEVLNKLKQFLVTETESGHISRQEAVSMIPPLVLDVKPHHKVLDMCAAPGSKTAQLVEALHMDENITQPEGFVVANDSDNKRCYLMVHQVKRLESPCYTITNHDASQLPGFREQTAEGSKLLKFDRVLADVPCTGDGTFRKNVDAWPKWNSAAGHNLHPLQSRILKRGLDVLEEGGRLVYSTCSLNPLEDEAVLASVLSTYEGSVELLDVSKELPGLRSYPGRSTWRVMSRMGDWFDSLEDVPEKLRTQIFPSMFPPSAEMAEKLHLERSMRILPHLQDTGGFFIAVMTKTEGPKTRKLREKTEAENLSEVTSIKKEPNEEEASDSKDTSVEAESETGSKRRDKRTPDDPDNPPPLKKLKLRGYKEDPFVFLDKDYAAWPSIKEFYGVSDDYPLDQLMIRCQESNGRNLYYVSSAIKELVQHNHEKIRFINHGLRVFNKSPSKYCSCDYRLAQDGIEHFLPYMSKRIVRATQSDIVTLLTGEAPFIRQLSPNLQDQLNQLDEQGSIVYMYDPSDEMNKEDAKPNCKMAVTGWKGLTSARTFLPKHDRAHYLRLCGVEFDGIITGLERDNIPSQNNQEGETNGDKEATEQVKSEEGNCGLKHGGTL